MISLLPNLHAELSNHFRSTDPVRAVVHQFGCALAYELADVPHGADICRLVALHIATSSKDPALCLDTARKLIAHYRSAGDADVGRKVAHGVGTAISVLMDAGQGQDALALAHELAATGWPDAESTAGNFIDFLTR